jgi:nucleoside-diphosphate-sugar epimerase
MKILVTGGCGYVGTVLITKLLKLNYKVISIDTKWFGDYLPKNKNLTNLKLDIKNINQNHLKNVNAIIHLASIANDPMSEIDKNLSWEVSCLGTFNLLINAAKSGVKKIIYASSSSVYGLKKEKNVTEKLSLKPISLYNSVKMITERIVMSFGEYLNYIIIRPATVCGYSPRMRYDLTVNALTFTALRKKKIIIEGGKQIRPNIHIDDLTDLYIFLIKNKKIKNQIYNAGFENLSVEKIANVIKKKIKSKLIYKKKIDLRSYRINSDKLLKSGFKPKKNINIAIEELISLYKKKKLRNYPNFFSVKWLKRQLYKNAQL